MFDLTTEQLLRAVDRLDYRVGILSDDDGVQFTAEHLETGERHIARADDPYAGACALARMVGIRLEG